MLCSWRIPTAAMIRIRASWMSAFEGLRSGRLRILPLYIPFLFLPSRLHFSDFPQPITAMAAVTKNLAFGITSSTSFEPPFLLAKRFSTLDHLTNGRIGWNIVTSWKKAAFKAIGLDSPIEHDERYRQADEYLRVLYKYACISLIE